MTNERNYSNLFVKTRNSNGVECQIEGFVCPQYDAQEKGCRVQETCPNSGFGHINQYPVREESE